MYLASTYLQLPVITPVQLIKSYILMNVGIRPRLKAQPSLYDLVKNRSIESLSNRHRLSFPSELPPELPPLPTSPAVSPPPTPEKAQLPASIQETINMAPKKTAAAKDADGEEQYGAYQPVAGTADPS